MPELLCRTERVEHARNFKTEVRGLMDVDHLIQRACIHRNMAHSHIHTILLTLFSDLSARFPREKFDMALFKNAVFSVSDRDSRAPRLHHKLQSYSGTDFFDVNQTWIVTYAQLDGLKQSHMGIATLEEATNLGLEMEEARIVVLILSPSYEKHTKSAAEIARTFGTLLMSDSLRQSLNDAADDDQIRDLLTDNAKSLSQQMTIQINGIPIDDNDDKESKFSVIYTHGYLGCINGIAGELCDPAEPLLFIFLLFGTTWLSMTIISFRSSPYLSRWKRDLVSDYALPISVLVFAFISFFGFKDVRKEQFRIFPRETDAFFIPFFHLPAKAQLPAIGLSIPLAILFFMDQLLVTNTVDNKDNKLVKIYCRMTLLPYRLKKGSAHHWDLLVVGILNIFLSMFGLPWMHGALPSAFLHLKALSDVEDRLHNGYIQTVYAISVFLFMAFSSLTGNEFWERILLIFTEQRAYPPTHYIRRVPQRIVHQFTIIEFIQLAILVVIGFAQYHYVEMVFPIVIAAFIPFRHFILPLFIRKQYLEAVDGKH
uniref:HCO3_cotransp domain-containing protein n=1 Tax=Caenorhabditis tropicalis TaxID=1561998 RepID=A0A1I7T050_9PELO